MATLYPVAGCKIYIGTAMDLPSADMVAADFTSVVWTEIKKWTQMGAFGDTAALITTQVISEARDIKHRARATLARCRMSLPSTPPIPVRSRSSLPKRRP